ncbi:MAG: glycosyl transferase family 28 [Chitinophagaceae bacterium]|nr:glycosyl transferase family 28 [Chitinophagaceae bacterium]
MMKGEDFNIPKIKNAGCNCPAGLGLGHVTRCIPIISKLLEQHCEVIVAASGAGKILLEKEFPNLTFISLKGYNVKYSQKKSWMPVKLLLQIPKLLLRINAERSWLKKMIIRYRIDAVISDNRPGLSCPNIPCVYITHQLQIKTGMYFTEYLAQKIHYHYINKFFTCWVPDAEGEANLAGELSHPKTMPNCPVIYLGPLSRFEKTATAQNYDLCILLSGPEPQRSLFEKMILTQLQHFSGSAILLRGLPGNNPDLKPGLNNLEVKNHLTTEALGQVLQQSAIIICRSGYTSIMDLLKLEKKAVLVPTPGQTEQEYLCRYLHGMHLFYGIEQENFSLEQAIQQIQHTGVVSVPVKTDTYIAVIAGFVLQLHRNHQ